MTVGEKLQQIDRGLWPLMPCGAKYELVVDVRGMVVVRLTVQAVLPDGKTQLKCLIHRERSIDTIKNQKNIVGYCRKVARDFKKELHI